MQGSSALDVSRSQESAEQREQQEQNDIGISVVSDLNSSINGASRQQGGIDRRIAWLEEDVMVLHRRLRDECSEGSEGTAANDPGLRALVARLDGDLATEKRSRESVEARIRTLEHSIIAERHDREAQIRSFSSELETTMRGLIGRIDDGLSAGAAAMRERTEQTETRLRTLIKRVDEGLSAGAAALQDTLGNGATINYPVAGSSDSASLSSGLREGRAPSRPGPRSGAVTPFSHGATPAATPSLAYPGTMQVPGSGLSGAMMAGSGGSMLLMQGGSNAPSRGGTQVQGVPKPVSTSFGRGSSSPTMQVRGGYPFGSAQ